MLDPAGQRAKIPGMTRRAWILALLASTAALPAAANDGAVQRAGRAVERGAKRTGEAVERGARRTGSALERAAGWTGERLRRAGAWAFGS